MSADSQAEDHAEKLVPLASVDGVKVEVITDKKDKKHKKSAKRDHNKHKSGSQKSRRKSKHSSDLDTVDDDSGSDSEPSGTSEDEKKKRKKNQKLLAKLAASSKKGKSKSKAKKSKKYVSSSDYTSSSDLSSSESDSEVDHKSRKKTIIISARKKKNSKRVISSDENTSSSTSDSSDSDSSSEDEHAKRRRARQKAKAKSKAKRSRKVTVITSSDDSSVSGDELVAPGEIVVQPTTSSDNIDTQVTRVEAMLANLKLKQTAASANATATKLDNVVRKNVLEFKRVDQVYDMKIRDWKLVESSKDTKDEFDCVFTVRRRLSWEGKYQETQVDIKSKVLRNCLQEIFSECKSISLVEDTPQLDPNTLFHYYDEIKTYVKRTLKPKLKRARRSKDKKLRNQQVSQCQLLLDYIDEDYTSVRKALKPMLKAGTITYDLVWALFKPNTIAYTPTYGNKDDPRCFRVDFSYEYESWLTQAKSLVVDGRYLEYDGKHFGLGDHQVQISAFKGHKKITSLTAYPLKYHKDPEVGTIR